MQELLNNAGFNWIELLCSFGAEGSNVHCSRAIIGLLHVVTFGGTFCQVFPQFRIQTICSCISDERQTCLITWYGKVQIEFVPFKQTKLAQRRSIQVPKSKAIFGALVKRVPNLEQWKSLFWMIYSNSRHKYFRVLIHSERHSCRPSINGGNEFRIPTTK